MMDIGYFISCLEDFESWWSSQASIDSTSYPSVMSEEEWFEQFTTWLNNQ